MFRGKCSIDDFRWQFGIAAGLFLAIFAAYPQLSLVIRRGAEWNGHYAYNDIDEVAYASYLKALIDGRPRKNDPYSGRDDRPGHPQPESLFSIQFAPAYAIALPARLFGIGLPSAMTGAGVAAGFLTALLCFFLIGWTTGADPPAAFAATLAVLCGGALAAGEGAIGEILGTGYSYPYFPFLRRYVPALAFPVFFAFMLIVWRLLGSIDLKRRLIAGIAAALCFAFLVFSYFYIWTAAVAWITLLFLLSAVVRPEGWKRDLRSLCFLAAAGLVPLAFYAALLSKRAPSIDKVQLLVHTHTPDIWRFPEYLSVLSLFVVFAGTALKRFHIRSRPAVFVLSLAAVPFILFNQQIISGLSLQPIHYQVFIGNYVAAFALAAAVCLFFQKELKTGNTATRIAAFLIALSAIIWGFVECFYTVRVLDAANSVRDEAIPVALRLNELSMGEQHPFQTTVFSVANIHADDSPSLSPQNVLWSRHQHIFAGLSSDEARERYFQYLYYQSLDEQWLERRLSEGDFVSTIALFGWGRHSARLSVAASPLTSEEITQMTGRFRDYIRRFGPEEAANPRLSFLVVPSGWNPDLTNLGKWYSIGEGEKLGGYVLHRLRVRRTARK